MNVIISPFSVKLMSGKENAKNYPYWEEVCKELREQEIKTIQVGIEGEKEIGADEIYFNLSFKDLEKLVEKCDIWISVDNFFPHFCNHLGKKGIVLFNKSDPNIFGYKQNINLLKDRKYLKQNQWDVWLSEAFNKDACILPEEIIKIILQKKKELKKED